MESDSETSPNTPGRNALLASLSDDDWARLRDILEPIKCEIRDIMFEPNGPISHVYFPLTGVLSLVVVMNDGLIVEAATVGNEGMVGMPIYLGSDTGPYRAMAQVSGDALRMTTENFKAEMEKQSTLHDALRRYNQCLTNQMAYSVACNRLTCPPENGP